MDFNIPLHDEEAERSLIASLIMRNDLFEECDMLNPDDFYPTHHQVIFETMLIMVSNHEKIDAGSLWYEIKKAKKCQGKINPQFFLDLLDNSPMFNTKKYVAIILECSVTRKIKTACMNVMDSSLVGEDLLSIAQSSMMGIKANARPDEIKNLKDIINTHIDRIEKANTSEEGMYYKLGFPRIDQCLKTIGPKLIIIAGRPGMGKTALAVTMTKNLDRAGVCVGFLSIEMPESEIIDRLIAMESGIDSSKFGKFKGLSERDFQDIGDSVSVFYESKIKIDGTGSLDIVDVERKCRKMKRDGVQVIFVDQLSQIGNRKVKSGEMTTRFAENCTRLAMLKKELGIPIFLLAQLNRDLKGRSNKAPIISDLKQSGKIEEDADAIIFVHRPEEYASDTEASELRGMAILDLAKNRNGAKFRDKRIKFFHETTYFSQESLYD